MRDRNFAAGVYEQGGEDGWKPVEWSRHSTRALAERAARRYAAACQEPTGGAYSWSAWWREDDGEPIGEWRVHVVQVQP